MELDQIDRKILTLLSGDSQLQFSEIGKRVNLSPTAVFNRVKKLMREKVIDRFTIKMNPDRLGKNVCAFVFISGSEPCFTMAKSLESMKEVEECYSITGDDSLLVKVRTPTTEALEKVLWKLRSFKGVERTRTIMTLNAFFDREISPEA